MNRVLADSSVVLDVLTDDPGWADWAQSTLAEYGETCELCVNAVIYAEVSVGLARIEELEAAIADVGLSLLPIPREALFLAGKVFVEYRRAGGSRRSPLPDFFIGAHAAVQELPLVTRDAGRFRRYFPTLRVVSP